ncbi:MAG TPA: flagellar hook basal-body protein [Terriglobales bacterium]|nr:flagellar hook basal-body protein [Terriglobales bacterium]
MGRSIYTAATGLITNARSMNVTGNNLANVETAGYKKDSLTRRSFGEHLTYLLVPGEGAGEIGAVTHGVISDETVTDFGQGSVSRTERSLDLAIGGEGFFTATGEAGELVLTRNGRFALDGEGYLTDGAGNRVLGGNGELRLQGANFAVDAAGNVYEDGELTATLRITCPTDGAAVVKLGEGYYGYAGEVAEFTGKIVQGALESSNVDVAAEMSRMISDTRAFQSCAQVVRTMDEMMQKGVQLGSLK